MRTNKGMPSGDKFFDELVAMLRFVTDRDPERAAALVGEWVDEAGEELDLGGPLVQP